MPVNVYVASGIVERLLRLQHAGAVTLPPRGIYVLAERADDDRLLAHEAAHWEQARELGVVGFYALYLLMLALYGWERHPMEIDARERAEAML